MIQKRSGRQLELFPEEHWLQPMLDWFAADGNSDKLQQLLAEIQTTPPRKRRFTSPSVRNADGSVYVSPRRLAKQAVVAVTCPDELWIGPFGVFEQIVGYGLERDRAYEETFDFYMDGLHAHIALSASKNGLDSATDGAELSAAV